MKRQKTFIQTRLRETTPEEELGETDLTNLPKRKFKIKVTTMQMELHRKMQELTDKVGRETTKIKQSLEGRKSRMDEMQKAIHGIETREQECIEADTER